MSELKVNSIKGVGASTAAITVNNTDGTCTANITNNLSNRNVVINGEFQIAQRATQVSNIASASSGYHTVDRWYTTTGSAGIWTQSRDTDVPAGTPFRYSLKMDCTTADSSLAAGDRLMLSYRIEGYDVQRFGKGTTSPKKFALSFWVKSPKTGTHIVELFDHDNSRHICKAYTISSANTWEQQKLVFDNETSNAFGNDNGKSFEIQFYLAAGSNYTSGTLATSWAANTNANRAVGQVNVADSTSNVFYLCGVQLEASDVCTDFEHRSFGQELALCQRYFHIIKTGSGEEFYLGQLQAYGSGACHGKYFHFPVTMRTKPTTTLSGNITPTNSSGSFTTNFSSATFDRNSPEFVGSNNTSGSSGLSAGNTSAIGLRENSSISSDAEL